VKHFSLDVGFDWSAQQSGGRMSWSRAIMCMYACARVCINSAQDKSKI
jgi:hypothetical protein